jgi:tetratricopeptide (TPR) repeat protein
VPDYRHHLARVHRSLAIRLANADHKLKEFHEAQAIWQQLAQDFPRVPKYRIELSRTYINLGEMFRRASRFLDAEQAFQQGMDIGTKLANDFPEVPAYHEQLAHGYILWAGLLAQCDKTSEGEQHLRKAVGIFEQLVEKFPAVSAYREKLAASYFNLTGRLRVDGRLAEAEEACRKAAALWEKLADEVPTAPGYRQSLAGTLNRLGLVLWKQKRQPEAIETYRQALAMQEKLAGEFPGINVSLGISISCTNLAWLLADELDSRLRDPAQAVEMAKRAVQFAPDRFEPWSTLGLALYRNGEWQGVIEALQKANQIEENGEHFFFLAMAHWQLGDKEKADQYFHKAVAWMDKNDPKDEDLRRHRTEAASLLGIKDEPQGKKD